MDKTLEPVLKTSFLDELVVMKSYAKTITFTDKMAPDGVDVIPVGEDINNGVVAWMQDDEIYVSSQRPDVPVVAHDCMHMFFNLGNIKHLDLIMLDTSEAVNTDKMIDGNNYPDSISHALPVTYEDFSRYLESVMGPILCR